MGKQHDHITPELAAWIARQQVFFVATAPLSAEGNLNTSPKGGDAFRVLGPMEVAYQDFTGSGAETAAHLRENGRIVVMFCAFDGPPKIVRLHGRGSVMVPGDARFAELASQFPAHPGTRAIVQIAVSRVSDSCGYGVPIYQFSGHRDALEKWADGKGEEGLRAYRTLKNQRSIDGLPAFEAGG
jgi:predicted pyridoxine 5'-phosphate oxidase superfamily flavin-nucleotide-binding protein